MGGGFLYQASTQSIRSSSGKVVIDSNGELAAENCKFKNGIFEGDFDCDVIKTSVQPQVYDAFTISDLTNRQAETFRTQVFASTKATYAYDTFYRCSIPAIPSVSFVKFFNKSSQTKSENKPIAGYTVTITLTFQSFITFYDSSYDEVDVSSFTNGKRVLHFKKKINEFFPEEDINFGTIVNNASIASYKYVTVMVAELSEVEISRETTEDGVMFSSSKSLTLATGGKRLEVSLPESSANLSKGTLYSDGGVVKIVT